MMRCGVMSRLTLLITLVLLLPGCAIQKAYSGNCGSTSLVFNKAYVEAVCAPASRTIVILPPADGKEMEELSRVIIENIPSQEELPPPGYEEGIEDPYMTSENHVLCLMRGCSITEIDAVYINSYASPLDQSTWSAIFDAVTTFGAWAAAKWFGGI